MPSLKLLMGTALVGLLVVVSSAMQGPDGVAAVQHQDDDDGDRPITGEALVRASAAALAATGGGRVTGTEVGDEEGYYEVEVTLDDGRQVDVHLNESFEVLRVESDEESPDDDEDPGAD